MDRICQANPCNNPSKYSCACDPSLRLCSDHIVNHINLAGTHPKIDINFNDLVKQMKNSKIDKIIMPIQRVKYQKERFQMPELEEF